MQENTFKNPQYMTTFKELFANLKKEIDACKITPYAEVDLQIYRRTSEQIALNGKSALIILAIFFALGWATTTFFEEVRISNRNNLIQKQKDLLSVEGADSVIFDCTHCGWKHTLELKK